MSNEQHIIIAGGGTGGHVFPAIAIARALQKKEDGVRLLFVGAKGKMEMQKVPEAGFEIVGLNIAGFNRSSFAKNLMLPFKILKSLMKARKIIKEFKPKAAVGVGGYASFPLLKMAQMRHVPTVIQEQNSYAGKTNMLLGKKAEKICVAYDHMDTFFPKEKTVKTGNPVRDVIVKGDYSGSGAKEKFGLNPDKPVLFVVGGSLGAKSVNDALLNGLDRLVDEGIQMIWQTGSASFEEVRKKTKPLEERIKVFEFIKKIEEAYAAADVIISRAGAMAVAELSIVGKPVVFVPYPYAAENHQVKNARALVNDEAALLVEDAVVEKELVDTVLDLLKDGEKQEKLKKNIKKHAITDADERIANEILALL